MPVAAVGGVGNFSRPAGLATGLTVTDNGDGTYTISGSGVTDSGDGTWTVSSTAMSDNGDGTWTAGP